MIPIDHESRAVRRAERLREIRAVSREVGQRLAVIVNGKRLGSVRLEQLPAFCGAITGGPRQ